MEETALEETGYTAALQEVETLQIGCPMSKVVAEKLVDAANRLCVERIAVL